MTNFWKWLSGYVERYNAAEISTRAAALAYHSLLAIVPTLGLFFWYLSGIGVTQRYLDLTRDYILSQIDVSSDQTFVDHFDRLTSAVQGNSWGWVGLILLLYTAANLIVRFGESLDAILGTARVRSDTNWSLVKLSLRRILVMLGLPVALTLSLVVTQWIRRDSWFHLLFESQMVGPFAALLIPLSVDILVFFLVYHFIPRMLVPGREALKAALIVGPLVEVSKFLLGLYNGYAVSVHRIYGVLSVIPMFILWVQILWIIVLSGALIIRFKTAEPRDRSVA